MTISIHLMFLLIMAGASLNIIATFYFNTSLVSINLEGQTGGCECKKKFQYISCFY